jgi:hypothetical protein
MDTTVVFIFTATTIFWFLSLIWTRKNLFNLLMKCVFVANAILGTFIIFRMFA